MEDDGPMDDADEPMDDEGDFEEPEEELGEEDGQPRPSAQYIARFCGMRRIRSTCGGSTVDGSTHDTAPPRATPSSRTPAVCPRVA